MTFTQEQKPPTGKKTEKLSTSNTIKKQEKSCFSHIGETLKVYTKEQVIAELTNRQKLLDKRYALRAKHNQKRTLQQPTREVVNTNPFYISGFKCISNFVQLNKGWIPRHEECCILCVRDAVSEFGDRSERINWNELNPELTVPVSRKQIYSKSKRKKLPKEYRGYRDKSFKGRTNNKRHEETLFELKNSGISISRRTKGTVYKDLYYFEPEDDNKLPLRKRPQNAKYAYVVVNGINGCPFISFCSDEDIVTEINKQLPKDAKPITLEELYSGEYKMDWIVNSKGA